MWGLTLDTIVSIDVVLANGTIAKASSTSYPDLFWAMRGSASSFGIATFIEFKTFAVPSYAITFEYGWDLSASRAADALGSFQSYASTDIAPEFGAELVLAKGGKSGNVSLQLTGAWYGAQSALDSTLQPFLSQMPTPSWSTRKGDGTYIDTVKVIGGPLDTSEAPDETDTFYAKSLMTPEDQPLTKDAQLAFMTYLSKEGFSTSTNWFVEVELSGGSNSKVNAVPLDDTSFGRRDSLFIIQFYTSSPTYDPPFPQAGLTFLDGLVGNITSSMPSDWNYGAYLNYIDDELADSQQLYYGSHYARLQSIKKTLDSGNVFSFPESVQA